MNSAKSGIVFSILALLFSTVGQSQTYTIGTDNGNNGQYQYPTPFGDYYKTQRAQYLYKASELTAAGMTSGYITDIEWTVEVLPAGTGATEDYTLKLSTTGTTSLGTSTWEPAGTVVWGPTDYTAVLGANSFELLSPFFWDGVSNIVVEVCGGSSGGVYTKNARVMWSGPLAFNGSHTRNSDIEANPCNYTGTDYYTGTPGGPTYRPVIKFTRVDGTNCTGTPEAGSAVSTASAVCVGQSFTVSIEPVIAVGITYQWQKSLDGLSWSNIAGAVATSYTTTQTVQTIYRCLVTCTLSGLFDFSNGVVVEQNDATECYCTPTYTTGTGEGDYISHVVLEDINNVTGALPSPYYEYYEALTADLEISTSHTISITVGTYLTNNGVAAWIDYNQDGDFSDAGEKLGEVTAIAAYGTGNINFTVPAGATIGTTRLRVRDVWNQTGISPCLEYGYGETEDYNINITPGLAPVADFIFSGDPTVSFTDVSAYSPTSWSWNFGDGGTSTLENPTHFYAVNGTYNVCLTATNASGSDVHCENVVIDSYLPPTAMFSYSGDPTVVFNDLSSEDPTSWFWDFGDGGTSTVQDPTHFYVTNGTYNVCLTSTNATGSDEYCANVIIDTYLAPTASFSFSGDPDVTFTDLSTEIPTSWFWDFDDGETSTLQNPVHTFAENGTYYVCLTATNAVGSNTSCQYVLIDSYEFAPVAAFTYFGDPTVFFVDFSTYVPTSWYWDFGDGGSSVEQNPEYTYPVNGTYSVCLTATNDIGSDTECQTVVIDGYPSPEAFFTYSGDPTVEFTDLSTNDPTTWFWDFEDGSFSTDQNPTHAFAENDVYTVCLTITGAGGVDTYCDNIEIEQAQLAPVSDFYYTIESGTTVAFYDLSANEPTAWTWEFGDGSISLLQNPTHTYAISGMYTACLTSSNGIGNDIECKVIQVTSSIATSHLAIENISPNPGTTYINFTIDQQLKDYTIDILNLLGQPCSIPVLVDDANGSSFTFNIESLPAGTYLIRLQTGNIIYSGSFIKQ